MKRNDVIKYNQLSSCENLDTQKLKEYLIQGYKVEVYPNFVIANGIKIKEIRKSSNLNDGEIIGLNLSTESVIKSSVRKKFFFKW